MSVKIRHVDFHPVDWLEGTAELSMEECGLYITACAAIYARGGPIARGHLRQLCRHDWHRKRDFDRRLERLVGLGKLQTLDGDRLDQQRCEDELARASRRVESAVENAGKRWGRTTARPQNDHVTTKTGPRKDQTVEPGSSEINGMPDANGYANHQPESCIAVEGPYVPSTAILDRACDAPPLPSQGDGGAPPTPAEPPDPTLAADADAAFKRCLDALRGKAVVLEAEAAEPAPPNSRLLLFRDRLHRLNAIAGERLAGDVRVAAWDVIGQAEALGDPAVLPAWMVTDLDAIERLEAFVEAAE